MGWGENVGEKRVWLIRYTALYEVGFIVVWDVAGM